MENINNNKDLFGRRRFTGYFNEYQENKYFDWEDRWNSKGSSLSSFFLKSKYHQSDSGLDTVTKVLSTMFKVVGVDKETTNLSFDKNKDTSIKIPLELLTKKDKFKREYFDESNFKEVDNFYGAALENVAAYVYDRENVSKINNNMYSIKHSSNPIKNIISTILTKERINDKLSKDYPGYGKFIKNFKNSTEGDYKNILENSPQFKEEKGAQLLDTVVKMMRYPNSVSEEMLTKFKEPIDSIKKLITKYTDPTTHLTDSYYQDDLLSNSISRVILNYELKEDEKEKKETPSKSSSEFGQEMFTKIFGSDPDKEFSSDLDKLAETFKEEFLNTEERKSEFDIKNEDNLNGTSEVDFVVALDDKKEYEYIKSRINISRVAAIRKKFRLLHKDYSYIIKSTKSGKFDTNKLVEGFLGIPTIYERMAHVSTSKLCVGILIDESGSMFGSSIESAQKAAIFLNEVFKDSKDIELFIYGHTADSLYIANEDIYSGYPVRQGSRYRYAGKTQIIIYKDKKVKNKYSLGNVRSKSNNRDGHAILAVARKIRSQTDRAGILFVISDGQPSASGYGGYSAIRDTRNSVNKAEALGFEVIQIAINEHVPSKEMFKNFITFTNITKLANDLSTYVVNKAAKKLNYKTTIV